MGFNAPSAGFASPVPAISQVLLTASITASSTQNTLGAVQTTITPSGGSAYTYAGTLSKPTGSSAALDSATIANPTFTPDKAGTYTVTLTATDTASGATVTKVRTQEVVSVLSISLTADSSQDTLNAVATTTTPTGGLGSINYSTTLLLPDRTSGSVSGGTTTTPSFTPTIAGIYVLTVTATDAAGQTATATRKVLVGTTALSVSIAAISDSASLPTSGTQALDSTVSNALGTVTYAWSGEDPSGAAISFSDATAADPTITYTATQLPGTWSATVTATDSARAQTASATVRWTTGGIPTATTPRSVLIYVSGGAPFWKEQVLIGSHWVDVAGSSGSLTVETDGGVTFSGTTMTIPDALAATSTGQGCPDERYVAFSSASSALQAQIATGAQLKLTFDQTSIANNNYARWGGAITSAAGSFDAAGENIVGARFGWETSAYRMQIAAASGGYNNATTSANLGPVQFGSQVGTANTGRVYWAAATYGSNFSGGTTTPTRLYLLGSAQTSPTVGTTAIVNPTIRAAFYPATL